VCDSGQLKAKHRRQQTNGQGKKKYRTSDHVEKLNRLGSANDSIALTGNQPVCQINARFVCELPPQKAFRLSR
jgi:hypothetical protein